MTKVPPDQGPSDSVTTRFIVRMVVTGIVGIYTPYGVSCAVYERQRFSAATNRQEAAVCRLLKLRKVEERSRVFVHQKVLAVADHTDDRGGALVLGVGCQADARADGFLVGPKPICHRLVDDDDPG